MDGPRAVRKAEFETLRALTDTVFWPGMMSRYPQLLNEDNLDNLRVCVEKGRCVSLVGMVQRQASLFGCPVRVCCIGAVSTLPDFRGRGLASACFDDAVTKAYKDGVDVMIVSGDRKLYRMRGCLRVGSELAFSLTAEAVAAIAHMQRPGVTVEPMRNEELPLVMACYQHEPVRFMRPLDDYRYALQCSLAEERLHPYDYFFAEFLTVRENDTFRGYIYLQRPGPDRHAHIAEFGGDRHALLAAFPAILRRYDPAKLNWRVQRHDTLLRSLCESAWLQGIPRPADGTVKLINFPQLMERMRPRWQELLDRQVAAELSFWQHGDLYGFRLGEEEFVADRDTTTRILFGAPDGLEEPAVPEQGPLAKTLRTILPLPCLAYGINYV